MEYRALLRSVSAYAGILSRTAASTFDHPDRKRRAELLTSGPQLNGRVDLALRRKRGIFANKGGGRHANGGTRFHTTGGKSVWGKDGRDETCPEQLFFASDEIVKQRMPINRGILALTRTLLHATSGLG